MFVQLGSWEKKLESLIPRVPVCRVSHLLFNQIYKGHLTSIRLNDMAVSTSGQDEANPVLWLATQGGKMDPSCRPLGIPHISPRRESCLWLYSKLFIDHAYSIKVAVDIGLILFCVFMDQDRVEVNNIQRSWPHPWSITHKFMRSGMNRLNQGLFSFLKLAWVRIMDWRIQYSMGRGRCIRKGNWMANRKINKGEEASREGTACFGTTKTKRGKTIT